MWKSFFKLKVNFSFWFWKRIFLRAPLPTGCRLLVCTGCFKGRDDLFCSAQSSFARTWSHSSNLTDNSSRNVAEHPYPLCCTDVNETGLWLPRMKGRNRYCPGNHSFLSNGSPCLSELNTGLSMCRLREICNLEVTCQEEGFTVRGQRHWRSKWGWLAAGMEGSE